MQRADGVTPPSDAQRESLARYLQKTFNWRAVGRGMNDS